MMLDSLTYPMALCALHLMPMVLDLARKFRISRQSASRLELPLLIPHLSGG